MPDNAASKQTSAEPKNPRADETAAELDAATSPTQPLPSGPQGNEVGQDD